MPVWTKICGIRTIEALDAALDGGATHVGLVFFAKSPRNVNMAQATTLANHAYGCARVVALIVDADDAALKEIEACFAIEILQLHGTESPERVAEIREMTGCKIWKAISVSTSVDVARADEYIDCADRILFDAKAPKGSVLPGGNGHAFDWRALDGVKGRFPFMLSGGLTPDNVADAIRATSPWAWMSHRASRALPV